MTSFWIGNVILLILNVPLIGIWIRILEIPYSILYPAILLFVCVGVFSVNNSVFDVFLVAVFGGVGYGMRVDELVPVDGVELILADEPHLDLKFRQPPDVFRLDPIGQFDVVHRLLHNALWHAVVLDTGSNHLIGVLAVELDRIDVLLNHRLHKVRVVTDELGRLGTENLSLLGVGFVPEGRRLFAGLTVRENLRLGYDAVRAPSTSPLRSAGPMEAERSTSGASPPRG